MLAAFPENYRLYEHVKKTEKEGKTEVKSKTHAAGGNDRQDAYLYGHPAGRRKRFRSPADFFPHLLWLVTDESGDPDNCSCKICCPDDLEAAIPGAKIKAERPVKQEADTITVASAPRPLISQTTKIKQEPSLSSKSRSPSLQAPTPTPLPKSRTADQALDRQYHSFMYRSGELVWFQRGQAWALGIILRRWLSPTGQASHYSYSVQPLSYPRHQQEPVVKTDHREFRPWLAWSVPRFTYDALNHLQMPPQYETADWRGLNERRYGEGNLEVDASIMAAKAIDSTYTPFGRVKTLEPEPGVVETHYNGIYLGAEKVWVGDPVRMVPGINTDIMMLHSVIERRRSAYPSHPPQIDLIGDVYTLSSVQHRSSDKNPNIAAGSGTLASPYFPNRMLEDLRERNNRSIAVRGFASYWRLIAAQSRLGLDDVKGRWYEASLLIPILQPAAYEQSAARGEVHEASLHMNARGDCVNANRPPTLPRLPKVNVRKETRKDALGQAVPPSVEIQDGVDAPTAESIDPALDSEGLSMQIGPCFDSAADAVKAQAGDGQASDLDEFMNLDGADIPGFGQEYATQTSQGGGYY